MIPIYNSSSWLEKLVLQIEQVMNRVGDTYEIVLVNDGSPQPETWPTMKEIVRRIPHLKAVNLRYNSGQFNALMCAMKHARGAYLITMDDDFQHDPSEIPKLIEKMRETDCDCVIGSYEHKEHNLFRRAGTRLVGYLSEKIYSKPKGMASTSFRIMKRELAESLLLYRGKKPQIGWMIFSLTKNVETVVVEHKKRAYGKSGYDARHLIRVTMDIIVNGSTFPLDLTSMGGIVISAVAFVIAIIYFILYLAGRIHVSGFTTLILAISFFSGVILFSIGMLGRYIGRLFQECIGFPAYDEKEIVCSGDQGDN
ncbi:MAG: glycosyltransferase family 2 protein [Clostridiales bacterium]|nr:glycosyltransferase family 2 protein [Clostridiales bacterium]